MIIRLILSAFLIYAAVWLESKAAMTTFLALITAANEVQEALRKRDRR